MSPQTKLKQVGTMGTILVVSKDDRALTLIDARSLRVLRKVELSGFTGHEVAVHSNQSLAYVPIYGDSPLGAVGTNGSTVDVIDLHRGERLTTFDVPSFSRPHCAAFGSDGLLYITTELDETVTVIETETLSIIRRLATGHSQAHMLALSPKGTRCYTANVEPGSISEMSTKSGALLRTIDITDKINRISLSADGSLAFTADQHRPRLAIVDLKAGVVDRWVDIPSIAFGTAATPDGTALILAMRGSNQVARLDLKAFSIEATVVVPPSPQMILIDPSGTLAYTACSSAGVLTAVRIADMTVTGTVECGKNPDGLAFAAG
ncbi:YncE family protein [Citricoccus nitrophenolicus]|uniref:YncE family protein n=1 Tax=Citricoccus nitrophenolicus TaxID=863575 RepID=UPI0039B49865